MKIIEHEIAGGKTIGALQFLHNNGGGIYVGSGETERYIASLCAKHGFENIRVVIVPPDTSVVIDNLERINLAVTKTKRKQLG